MKVRRALRMATRRTISRLKSITFNAFTGSPGRQFVLPNSSRLWGHETGDGTGSAIVQAPVQWVARNFTQAPLQVSQILNDGQSETVGNHDLVRLIRRPNDHYSGHAMWMATVASFMVDGNAYWLKVRSEAGRVVQLWWIPHWLIAPWHRIRPGMPTPNADDDPFLPAYLYQPGGVPMFVDPADVVHFRHGLDGNDPRLGASPLKSVLREVFSDDEAANFTSSLLRNMGVPGLIVSPSGDHVLSSEERDAAEEHLTARFTGDRRGLPLVNRGATQLQQFGFTPEQMDLRNLRRLPEERVTAVLGVAAIVAGLGAGLDRSTFANMAEARAMAWEDTVIPTQSILAEDVRNQLLYEFEDDADSYEVTFDTSDVKVLREDENERATRWDVLVRGGIATRAEARREFGLDAGPGDDVYLQPISTFERPAGVAPDALPSPDPQLRGRKAIGQDAMGHRLIRALERDEPALAAAMTRDLTAVFNDLGEAAEEAFRAVNINLAGRKQDADSSVVDSIIRSVGLASFVDRIRTQFETSYLRTAQQTVDTINAVTELGIGLPDPVARRVVEMGGRRAGLVDLSGDTRRALFRALADARADGLGPPDAARLVREYVPAGRFSGAGVNYRAEMIARTETKYAQNVSSIEAYKGSDVVVGLVVYDNRTGHDDDDCVERDGQVVDFDTAEQMRDDEHPNGTLHFGPATRENVTT